MDYDNRIRIVLLRIALEQLLSQDTLHGEMQNCQRVGISLTRQNVDCSETRTYVGRRIDPRLLGDMVERV